MLGEQRVDPLLGPPLEFALPLIESMTLGGSHPLAQTRVEPPSLPHLRRDTAAAIPDRHPPPHERAKLLAAARFCSRNCGRVPKRGSHAGTESQPARRRSRWRLARSRLVCDCTIKEGGGASACCKTAAIRAATASRSPAMAARPNSASTVRYPARCTISPRVGASAYTDSTTRSSRTSPTHPTPSDRATESWPAGP